MKIIHTADWHLCNRLGPRIDRTYDLQSRVERVAELCDEHAADVLLIAGDLFSDQATVDQMTEALVHLRTTFTPFFKRGGTILAITGNHDRDGKINAYRTGMTLAVPVLGRDENLPSGRMYLVNGRALATLVGANGQRVQFVLVPYPNRSRYELPQTGYTALEEENRLLRKAVADWIGEISSGPQFDPTLPTVLAAHLHVRGGEVHSLYQLTERDDVLFDFADLNPGWAYVALGHIHKPQALNGQHNVRYPGSLDRLDRTETHDDHGVLFVEVGKTGLVRDPERLQIPATPFHTVVLDDPETELPTLADRYPDRETAIVHVIVNPTSTGPSRDEIDRQLRRLFPRLHPPIIWSRAQEASDSVQSSPINPRAGFATTIRDWLTDQLKDDRDKDELMAMAEAFLVEGGTP
jgi:DNA repair protein SbcD/Mre11